MAHLFDVTAASETVNLHEGKGQVAFTASNVSGRALRGRAVLVAKDATLKPWLSLSVEPEQDFAPGATKQFTVTVKAAAGAKPGKYTARLDLVSVENPDEDYTQGPTVAVVVLEASAAPKKKFPYWIFAVAALFLIILAGGLWYVLSPKKISVPDVTRISVDDAKQKLAKAKLKEADTQQMTTGTPAGQVISQQPVAGTSVEEGTTVTLTVAAPLRIGPIIRVPPRPEPPRPVERK
jgi:PASTA domain